MFNAALPALQVLRGSAERSCFTTSLQGKWDIHKRRRCWHTQCKTATTRSTIQGPTAMTVLHFNVGVYQFIGFGSLRMKLKCFKETRRNRQKHTCTAPTDPREMNARSPSKSLRETTSLLARLIRILFEGNRDVTLVIKPVRTREHDFQQSNTFRNKNDLSQTLQ